MTSNVNIPSLVPPNAWDTHIHVFEPDKHPYSPTRSYTPAPAPLGSYPHQASGCTNILVVQATVQGKSPAPLVGLLTRIGQTVPASKGLCRGLTVLDLEQTADQELDQLHASGIRGVRMHEVSWGFGHQATDDAVANKIRLTAQRLNRLGWVIDLYLHPQAWAAIVPIIDTLPDATKIIADHWAGFRPGDETSAEFKTLVDLVRRRRIYVKLSAFERQYHGHPDGILSLGPMVRALIETGPDRLMFGSDWPNTALASSREGKSAEERLRSVEEYRQVDHSLHVRQLREWMKDDDTWNKFWVDTPTSLFQ
ncbi:hypothetical protein LCI18_013830 [Fusarium solani-melongenae]|uniref:Uncharacterized protein n=1 Tax=Fusarium solani subsp. cucurbitae TaxID=2747967 RepID=A0ACD3ZP84_FUSSC|nr:hypothetical protein LCI18_013830 [Fusarium solani-melongenae]